MRTAEGPRTLRAALGVAFASALVLAVTAGLFEPGRLHVHTWWNDQAGYVTTARRLVDTGELRSGLVYPSLVRSDATRLYMPGHYLALAASYGLFGWGVLPSLLPSLVAYVLVVTSAFLIGARLHGRRAGLGAGLLVALFPPHLAFAFSAMAEMTLLAAALGAVAAFLHLPGRARPLCGALLIGVPFLFRETGALLALPLALVLLAEGRESGSTAHGLGRAAAFGLAAVAITWGLQRWQLASGKAAVPLSWVTSGGFNYEDALARPPHLSPGEWWTAIGDNLSRNVALLRQLVFRRPGNFEPIAFCLLVASFAGALVVAALPRGGARARAFALGSGLLGLALLALTFTLYDVKGGKTVRSALLAAPLCLVAVAGAVDALVGRVLAGRAVARVALALVLAALVGGAWTGARLGAGSMTRRDEQADSDTAMLERLEHDDRLLLVAPHALALDYVVRHYPVPWSFVPANDGTMRLLLQRYEVGTVVLPSTHWGLVDPDTLTAAGLRPALRFRHRELEYAVYRRGAARPGG